MSRIIFDIETAGVDFESLEPEVQDYFLQWANDEDEVLKVKESLSFYPHTGEVVAIGMLNPDTSKGVVYFQCPNNSVSSFEEDGLHYEPGSEKGILENFRNTINKYDNFI